MKVKIRKGLFETNSSSIHTLAVTRNRGDVEYPDEIELKRDSFGWGFSVIHDWQDKCNYIFEMCINKDNEEELLTKESTKNSYGWTDEKIIGYSEDGCIAKFVQYLTSKGIEVETYFGTDIYDGGIDHCDCWGNDIKEFLSDEGWLDAFLFDDTSYIILSNDNGYYNNAVVGPFDTYDKCN